MIKKLAAVLAALAILIYPVRAANEGFNALINSLPGASTPLTGNELVPLLQSGVSKSIFPQVILQMMAGDCTATGVVVTCTKTNGVAFGPLATGGSLTGDCTTSGAAITCLSTNGTAFGTFATANAATPPAIGTTTPAAGTFTALGATGAITGNIAALNNVDQNLTGGANVTSNNLGTVASGTTTIDCGKSPLQYFTNGGASTLAAPANDGSCIVLMTNNASAGAITFSGFNVGSNTGDALNTTNTSKFSISIWRINGTSGYTVSVHQ